MKGKLSTILVILLGIILISIVAITILTSGKTLKTYVAAKPIVAGSTIKPEDIAMVDVSVKTPGPFIKSKDLIIGNKIKNNMEQGQLFYPADFLESWESYNQNKEIPEDYIIVSIQVPDNHACGGLIVAGDFVDIMAIPKKDNETNLIGERFDVHPRYISANVRVINTNSSLAKAKQNDLSALVQEAGSGGSDKGNYYILAVSYDTYKKIMEYNEVKDYDLYLNICPRQNATNEPLLEQMIGKYQGGLHNEEHPIFDKEGNMIEDVKQIYEKEPETVVDNTGKVKNDDSNDSFGILEDYNNY